MEGQMMGRNKSFKKKEKKREENEIKLKDNK